MPGTGSKRLDYVVEQIWGPGLRRGEARAVVSESTPEGWEVREHYWAIPNAESAQLLVPHSPRVAARTLADYADLRPMRTRLARRTLAAAVSVRVPLSRDSLRLVAPIGGPATAVEKLAELVGVRGAFATFGVRLAANAKPTIELRDAEGDAVGFVKLAWNDLTLHAVQNEGTATSTMSGRSKERGILAPRLLADGELEGHPFVMIEPLPRGIRHVPATHTSLSQQEALGPGRVHRLASLGSTEQAQRILHVLHSTTSTTPSALTDRASRLAGLLTATPVLLPVADFWHGDFVWWNTGRDPLGRLWLFDWETAELDAAAGLDTLHWYAHTKDAENPHSVVERCSDALSRAKPLLRSLGHSRASTAVLAAWYALTLVANEIRLAESLKGWERVKHAAPILEQILGWAQAQFDSRPPRA